MVLKTLRTTLIEGRQFLVHLSLFIQTYTTQLVQLSLKHWYTPMLCPLTSLYEFKRAACWIDVAVLNYHTASTSDFAPMVTTFKVVGWSWNPGTEQTLNVREEDVEPFYKAYIKLQQIVNRKELWVWAHLRYSLIRDLENVLRRLWKIVFFSLFTWYF